MSENNGTEFKPEGQPAFGADKETDSSDSFTENTDTNQTGSSDQNKKETDKNGGEDDRLFNHPRWQERESDWKERYNQQEQRHLEAIERLRGEFTKYSPKTETEVPSWFGGDENQWREYQVYQQSLIGQAKTEALKDIESKGNAEKKAIDDATKYFNDEVVSLETDKTINPEGKNIDRNKLLKYVLDNDIVDSKGRWNYKAAFKSMQPGDVFKAKEAMNERKAIASATTSERGSETKPPAYMTSKDFKDPSNRPW